MKYVYKCTDCNWEQESDEDLSIIHICEACGRVDIPLVQVNLYEFNPDYIVYQIDKELLRRDRKESSKVKYMWKTRDGRFVPFKKMSTTHLIHLKSMLLALD